MSRKSRKHKNVETSESVSEEVEVNVSSIIKLNKTYIPHIILILILIMGLSLRYFHVSYPVIGYHNWKTAHYLTEARNFDREGFFKYGFFIPAHDTLEVIDEPASGIHTDSFPTDGITVALFFKIFGESLALARIINIIYSLLAVLAFYFLIKELFEREDIALMCTFLAALSPLFVFFSHNVDLINPALFFMVLGSYFYVRWLKYQLKEHRFSYLYIAAFFIMFGTVTKYSFGIIAVPILFTFPYLKVFKSWKRFIVPFIITGIILSAFPAWILYGEWYKINVYGKQYANGIPPEQAEFLGLSSFIDFGIIGNVEFWQIMRSYAADNYTLIGVAFAFLGLGLFLLLYFLKNRQSLGYNFMLGYFLGTLIYLFIMGFKLSGHSYHQFPVAPLIIFMIAYFIVVLAANIAGFVKDKGINLIIKIGIIFLLVFILPLPATSLFHRSMESRDRMFDTQFPGIDIAGDYIREHAAPNDRFFHSSGQSFGILWHADRKGYKPPRSAEYFKEAEDKYNVSWVFVYSWAIPAYFQNPEIYDYLQSHYHLVQFGFVSVSQQQVQPLFFLFKKGGSFNESELNTLLQNHQIMYKDYEYIQSSLIPFVYDKQPFRVNYINLE
jgi:hypothetical protein